MLIETVESKSVLETDLCVVGGGAVGLSIARLLADSGLEVTLLEGGGRTYDEASQELYVGLAEGTVLPYKSAYLTTSRLRYLGGSTNHWQGWCRPLDPVDFEPRSWVPESGWPITAETLQAYDDRAAELAEIGPFRAPQAGQDEEGTTARERWRRLFPPGTGFETSLIHISPPTKFGERYAPELERAEDCRLHLNASVVEIVTDEHGGRVEHVEVVGGDGQRYKVRARAFVLATGAIENARLLLASNRHEAGGVGNRNDLVGRYYMDHPFLDAAFVVLPHRRRVMHQYAQDIERPSGEQVRAIIRPDDELQRTEKLLNSLAVLQLVEPRDAPDLARDVKAISQDLTELVSRSKDETPRAAYFAFARLAGEQVPNPDSRVMLGDETDALGMPRPHLDWRLGEQDAESVRRTMSLLAARLGWSFRGRLRLLVNAEDPWPNATGSNHHLGTTRMSDDPRRGVVDADCRVHGVSNLWVGGSSVFATGGASNPTFSLLSLTVRLAEHLRGVLTR